ncbi:Endonuclease/exonuclease/phosphatase [Mycena filopes]|nr:Endonuclease/exonuclease/phosphatase [Mycena filopes]
MSMLSGWTRLRSLLPSMSAPISAPAASRNKLYYYDGAVGKGRWVRGTPETTPGPLPPHAKFLLVSWNVDFAASLQIPRFRAALDHLERRLSPHFVSPPPPPAIILLQEVYKACFATLLENAFIREFYHVTNVASEFRYSTVTLVPKALAGLVSAAERVSFTRELTRMERDCVYVELEVPLPARVVRLRVANAHLESLTGFGDRARPKQLKLMADLLTARGVDGGLVAGDMNCISESDQGLPERLGLMDAWTSVRPTEVDGADDHTWGYQPRGQFPPRRMDKVLTVGALNATDIERVGVGLKLKDEPKKIENEEDEDSDEEDGVWVSDHYGLLATIVLPSE